jgi:hypothetical protein
MAECGQNCRAACGARANIPATISRPSGSNRCWPVCGAGQRDARDEMCMKESYIHV